MRTDATMVDSSRTITPGSFSSPRSSISPEGNSRPRLSEKDWDQWTPRSTPWNPAKTPFSALVHHDWEGSGTKSHPYLIGWLPGDVEDPQNWSALRKWSLTAFVSIATLAVALASSAYSGTTKSIKADLGGSQELLILGVSLFVLGFALGPLLWAPLSEVLGRRNLFMFTYLMMTFWLGVSVASPNLASLLVFRFLAGAFGSSSLTNSGGTIADCHSQKQRGLAMASFSAAPFLGPALGPIIGGFLGDAGGWKWVEGLLAIFAAVITFIGFFLHSESYAPYMLRQRALLLSKATGDYYRSRADEGKDLSVKTQFKVALSRPWQLLFREPIVAILSLYVAIIYATLYSFFSAFPLEFQVLRGWSAGVGGLAFLGLLVGMLAAIAYIIFYENPRYIRKSEEIGTMPPPEERLPPAMIGGVLAVIGLAWFTGTNGPEVHYIVPIIASVPFGSGMVLIFLGLMNYLVDSYVIMAASVLAANSTVRSLFGAAWPLFTSYSYMPAGMPLEKGIHVGSAIALALALLCLPAPFVLYKKGAAIRLRCKYAAEAARVLDQMLAQKQTQPAKPKVGPASTPGHHGEETLGGGTPMEKVDGAGVEGKLQKYAQEPQGAAKDLEEGGGGGDGEGKSQEEWSEGKDGDIGSRRMPT